MQETIEELDEAVLRLARDAEMGSVAELLQAEILKGIVASGLRAAPVVYKIDLEAARGQTGYGVGQRTNRGDFMKVNFNGKDYGLQFQEYGNGRPAIVLVGRRGETAAVATVNVPDVQLLPNQVLIKDYSENEGMLAALEKAGIVKTTGVSVGGGHVSMPVCELLVSAPEKSKDRRIDAGPKPATWI